MGAVTIKTSNDRFIISIEKNKINKDILLQFIDNLRLESLAEKVDFGEEIEVISEQLKEEWWKKNKDIYTQGKNF